MAILVVRKRSMLLAIRQQVFTLSTHLADILWYLGDLGTLYLIYLVGPGFRPDCHLLEATLTLRPR